MSNSFKELKYNALNTYLVLYIGNSIIDMLIEDKCIQDQLLAIINGWGMDYK
jgi:hypothetical protein